MAGTIVATPQVSVNDVVVDIVPNTLKIKEGQGEHKILVASSGGQSVETYFTTDISTYFSEITFSVFSTDEHLENIKIWKANRDSNIVTVLDTSGFGRSQQRALITIDPIKNTGMDGQTEITFHGRPLV